MRESGEKKMPEMKANASKPTIAKVMIEKMRENERRKRKTPKNG